MKVWLATDVVGLGAGLGKMDVIFIPREGGKSLTINVTRDSRVWIDEELDGQPGPDDGFLEIDIDENLADVINVSHDKNHGRLPLETAQQLIKLVRRHLPY